MSAVRPKEPQRTRAASSRELDDLSRARAIRRIVLDESRRAGVGHIGSALSVADIVAALFAPTVLTGDPEENDRDRFVLSKGHASLALYAALHLRGWLTAEELSTYCSDGTALGTHPEADVRGIDFATGSLGQGLSLAAGAALAGRLDASSRRAYCLMSDAECNEGSIWEAVMFAAHHRLANLVAIVDVNGQQALGYTRDVLDLSPLADKWRVFGWDVHEVDGHDVVGMRDTILGLDTESAPPHVLLGKTTFGKGVSYMESRIEWHYKPMSEAEYVQACVEVDA